MVFPFLLVACDIQAVSVGVWDVQIESAAGIEHAVWSIVADGSISMAGDTAAEVNIELIEGSRIAWSYAVADPAVPGEVLDANFSGTVDGNRLQGTIFTVLGNWTVSGIRH